MQERDIHKTMLVQYARRLYTTAGKVNLYISLCCEKPVQNNKKLKSEIQMIKELVSNIEFEIDNI